MSLCCAYSLEKVGWASLAKAALEGVRLGGIAVCLVCSGIAMSVIDTGIGNLTLPTLLMVEKIVNSEIRTADSEKRSREQDATSVSTRPASGIGPAAELNEARNIFEMPLL